MKEFAKIFDLFRAALYLFLGCYILIDKQILPTIVPVFKMVLGISVVLYGIFRLYQVYIKHFRKQQDENN